jgi:hypothetical protein
VNTNVILAKNKTTLSYIAYMDKKDYIDQIIKDIYNLNIPEIEETRKEQIANIIDIAINGDTIEKYLVIDVIIQNNKPAIYVYVLTNKRLVVFSVNTTGDVNSRPFPLYEIQEVRFSSPKVNKTSVEIILLDDKLLGLTYLAKNTKATTFFQELDQVLFSKR